MRAWGLGVVVLVVAIGGPTSAQDGLWSTLPPGPIAGCAEGSEAAFQAADALARFDRRVESLTPSEPVAPVLADLYSLVRTDCFRLAAESPRVPRPDSSTALVEWWREGGHDWLASYLERPVAGPIAGPPPQVLLPPDTRRTLDLKVTPDHPLARFLCQPGDAVCAADTRGWRSRAEAAFDNHRARGRHTIEPGGPWDYTPEHAEAASAACAAAPLVEGESGPDRYARWRACLEGRRFTRPALPLGSVKAPSEGWLIVQGRRGHYEFCDTVRAFDLTTGAAFMWDSCSGLALRPDGSVDRATTDAGRSVRVVQGTVSVAALREATWMMLLRGETREAQLTDQWFPLPRGVEPAIPGPVGPAADEWASGLPWSSAQTTLTWRLVLPDRTGFSGDLTWPGSYDAAEDHAAALLEIAEQGLVSGCAGRAPRQSLVRESSSVALNELLDEADARLQELYESAARRWRVARNCRIRPTP